MKRGRCASARTLLSGGRPAVPLATMRHTILQVHVRRYCGAPEAGSSPGASMALTPSSMPALGMPAADFTLPDTVSDRRLGLSQLKSGKATVVMFLSNHCPYVKHVLEGLVRLAHDYRSKGVSFIAIGCSDTETYPEDSPERMRLLAQRQGFPFPYLYDEWQEVARA